MKCLLGLVLLLAACGADAVPSSDALPRVIGGPGRSPGRFVTPRGISVANGVVWVVDRSGRLQQLTPEGKFLRECTVTEGTKGFPIGVLALPDGRGVLIDTHQARIRIFRADLTEESRFGHFAPADGGFSLPQRATCAADGSLLITEFGEGPPNRIQVRTRAGDLVRMIGGVAPEQGGLTRPMGIARIGEEIFCADVSDRILVYDLEGRLLRVLGKTGNLAGEFRYPYGVCAVNGILYVAEYTNHRIQRLRPDGECLGVYGTPGRGDGELNGPWDVAADENGLLYVCDTGNHRVLVIDPAQVSWRMP